MAFKITDGERIDDYLTISEIDQKIRFQYDGRGYHELNKQEQKQAINPTYPDLKPCKYRKEDLTHTVLCMKYDQYISAKYCLCCRKREE